MARRDSTYSYDVIKHKADSTQWISETWQYIPSVHSYRILLAVANFRDTRGNTLIKATILDPTCRYVAVPQYFHGIVPSALHQIWPKLKIGVEISWYEKSFTQKASITEMNNFRTGVLACPDNDMTFVGSQSEMTLWWDKRVSLDLHSVVIGSNEDRTTFVSRCTLPPLALDADADDPDDHTWTVMIGWF